MWGDRGRSLEWSRCCRRRRAGDSVFWRFLCVLGVDDGCQIGLSDAHGLGDLDQDALVQAELIPLMQLVALFPVCVADVVPCLVAHHDAVVEGMEFEESILPSLLLPPDIVGEETSKFGDWCGL